MSSLRDFLLNLLSPYAVEKEVVSPPFLEEGEGLENSFDPPLPPSPQPAATSLASSPFETNSMNTIELGGDRSPQGAPPLHNPASTSSIPATSHHPPPYQFHFNPHDEAADLIQAYVLVQEERAKVPTRKRKRVLLLEDSEEEEGDSIVSGPIVDQKEEEVTGEKVTGREDVDQENAELVDLMEIDEKEEKLSLLEEDDDDEKEEEEDDKDDDDDEEVEEDSSDEEDAEDEKNRDESKSQEEEDDEDENEDEDDEGDEKDSEKDDEKKEGEVMEKVNDIWEQVEAKQRLWFNGANRIPLLPSHYAKEGVVNLVSSSSSLSSNQEEGRPKRKKPRTE